MNYVKMPHNMENSNNNNLKTESHAASNLHTLVDAISYGVAGYSGWLATDLSIRTGMYKNLASQGVFDDIQKQRKSDYQNLLREAETGNQIILPEKIRVLEETYRDSVRQRIEGLGIKGMEDWWKLLKRNQKMDAIVQGLTVSGIAIGALMLVTNSREFNALVARGADGDNGRAAT